MDLSLWIGVGFSGCCCIAFFLAFFGILTMVMRPKKRIGEPVEGVAPAPKPGQATRASLTRLEEREPPRR